MAGGQVAPGGGAALVADGQRDPLGAGVEPAASPDVEDLAGAAEDDGDDAGGAGQASGLGGGDLATGVDPGGAETGQELFEGHRDHDRGRTTTDPR